MQWVELSAQQRARRRFAVIGAAVIVASLAGLLVGWSEAQSKDLTPAEVVAFRFPSAWNNLAAQPAPGVTAIAKQNQILFDPNPSYDLASADSRPVVPSGVLAYADPVEAVSSAAARAPEARPAEKKAPPRVAKPDNHVLNDAQISAIKARLKLTADQQRYWPAVEAELRKMEYRKDSKSQGSRLAAIDISKVDVEGLKSAGFPLVMSFSDDQRRELKSLAHLLGLEHVMSGI